MGVAYGSGDVGASRQYAQQCLMNLHPAAGIRAVACLGVMVGHAMFWSARSAPDKLVIYSILDSYPWISGIMKMPQIFMDTFFILTGFMAGHTLVDALPRVSNVVHFILRYYYGRVKKILPSLYTMLVFVYLCVIPMTRSSFISSGAWKAFVEVDPFNQENCPHQLWANFIFVNNLLPYAGCVSYTWSLAVQMQFYLLVPFAFLLCRPLSPHFRRNVSFMAVLLVVISLMHRLYVMNLVRLWEMIPIPFYGPYPGDTLLRMNNLWSRSYLSLFSRVTPLCLGVLAYLALSSPMTNTIIVRHEGKLTLLALALIWLVIVDCCSNIYGPTPNAKHPAANPYVLAIGFVVFTGLLQPLLPCVLIILLCKGHNEGLARIIAHTLSRAWLSHLAHISFNVYLLHPIIILAIWSLYPPSKWFVPYSAMPFAFITTVITVLSIFMAVIHSEIIRMSSMHATRLINVYNWRGKIL